MSFIYSLAVLGLPTATQLSELENAVADAVSMFGLRVGQEIGWEISPDTFIPNQQRSSAVVFFGGLGADHPSLPGLLRSGVPSCLTYVEWRPKSRNSYVHSIVCPTPMVGRKGSPPRFWSAQACFRSNAGSLSVIGETRLVRRHCRCSMLFLLGILTFSWIHTALRRQKIFRPCYGIDFVTLTCY